jgi:hypothetical protein
VVFDQLFERARVVIAQNGGADLVVGFLKGPGLSGVIPSDRSQRLCSIHAQSSVHIDHHTGLPNFAQTLLVKTDSVSPHRQVRKRVKTLACWSWRCV